MGALSEFLEREFGYALRSKDSAPAVGTSATKIVNNNPDRLELIISNPTANIVYIALNSGVALARGILVPPDGGSVTFTAREDGDLVGREWWGIASATSNLYIVEVEKA